MDETPQLTGTKKLDIGFIVTGVCLVLFGAGLGYFLCFSIQLESASTGKISVIQNVEPARIIADADHGLKSDETAILVNNKTDEVLEDFVEPDTLIGSRFILKDGEMEVHMNYPETVRIVKSGFLDLNTVNYGRKDFDTYKPISYRIESVEDNSISAQLDLIETTYIFNDWDKEVQYVYEKYSDVFYGIGRFDYSEFQPRIIKTESLGKPIYIFESEDSETNVIEYVRLNPGPNYIPTPLFKLRLETDVSRGSTTEEMEDYKTNVVSFKTLLESMLRSIFIVDGQPKGE